MFDESDESLLERWVENPYWQHFCGFQTMQHQVPPHPTSLTKWRQRARISRTSRCRKVAGMLEETIALALREKQVTKKELAQVNVDTAILTTP